MSNILWLIQRSIALDLKLIQVSKWTNSKKIQFIFIKYFILIKHKFIKFELGKSSAFLFGEKIYYDSNFGLADYQSILCRHQNLLKINHIRSVSTIIDVGANVGFFSKMVRSLYPNSKIYAIEPVPAILAIIKKNFIKDSNTKLFDFAAFDKKGKQKMIFNKYDSVASKISRNGNFYINTNTLDNFIKEQGIKDIDILKIDVETFENYVLLGSKSALSKTKYLFLEITIKNNPNYSISSLMSLLYSKKYNFQLLSFRNYADVSEGEMPIMDCLFENLNFRKSVI
jgi:FkbM family methyltransferase